MAINLDFLKSNPYFSKLSSAELDAVRRSIFEKKAERGEIILFEGKPAGALYFVVSGVVKVFKTSADGKEQILQLIRPGESFNDVPVFSAGFNLASAEAMGPVILYVLKKDDLKMLFRGHPQLTLSTIQVLSQRVQHLMSLIEDLSFKHVVGRVAKILLENAGDGTKQGQRLTQQDMAAMAGTAREIVGRSLKALEKDGLIKFDHHRIIITNRKALGELAGVL